MAAYLAYIFLVPFMKVEIGGYVLQWNFINILVLLAFFVNQYRKNDGIFKFDYRPLIPFFIYFGVSLVLMPFQDGMPAGEALNTWRMQVMKYLILPFVIWNDIKVNHASIKLYRNVTIGCIIISALYGLYLTTMPGINPYMIFISEANGVEFDLDYAAGITKSGIDDGRLFGRISSVFGHPMTFGLFLGLALFYLYRNKKNINIWLFYGLISFVLTDIVVCGVRSVIGATIITLLFILIQSRNFKILSVAATCLCLFLILTTSFPSLHIYFYSIIDRTSADIHGSSIELRLSQLEGCFQEIQNTLFLGKGFGWTGHYLSLYEVHPTMLAFESLIFVILCNSGLLGMFLWIYMSVKVIAFNNLKVHPTDYLLNALLTFYIAYACITGEYGYMQYFILFYILLLGEEIYKNYNRMNNI